MNKLLALVALLLTGCTHVPKYSVGDCVDINFILHLDEKEKFDSGMYPISIMVDAISKDKKYYKFKLFDPKEHYKFLKYSDSKQKADEWYAEVNTIDNIDQNYTFYPLVPSEKNDNAHCNRVGK
jgi:hypothetical protein